MQLRAKKRSRSAALVYAALPYLIIAVVLVAWELLVRLNGIQPIFLPAPSSILRYLVAMLLDGSLIYNLSITFMRILGGFVVAAVSGILVGVAMGMSLAGLLPSIGKLARQSVDERATGQMLGYLQSAQFSGQVLGPLAGGVIGVHLGLHSVFFATAALLAACAGLAHWARGR